MRVFYYYKETNEKIAYKTIHTITAVIFHDLTNLHTSNDVIVVTPKDIRGILV